MLLLRITCYLLLFCIRYTFYLDFLAPELDDRAQNALMHLREQAQFVRVLGSYPRNSQLIGPIKKYLEVLGNLPVTTEFPSISVFSAPKKTPLRVGIIGFGKFGQFLAKTFAKEHNVYAVGRGDMTQQASSPTHPFTHSINHPPTHSINQSITLPLTQSHSLSLPHPVSLTHSLTHSVSLTHSLTQSHSVTH